MKKLKSLLLSAALALLAVSSVQAQTGTVIIVEKLTQYVQTSASAPALATGNPGGAYRFDVSISNLDNSNLSGITPPTVTLASGSTAPSVITTGHNGGTLVYNVDENEWRYGYADAVGWNVGSVGALNTLFANGAYSVTSEGNSYSLNNSLNSPGFPGAIPTLTLSGGSWSGGKYVIDVNQALTITTSSNFTGYETTGIGALIGLNLGDVQSDHHVSRIGPVGITPNDDGNPNNNFATFTIAAGTLTAGQDYEGWATFARIVAQDTSQAGVFAVAWWGNETSFTVSAVPEPSTYAALAGLGALGLAFWRRRQRATAA